MPDVSGPEGGKPAVHSYLPPAAGLDGFMDRTAAEAALEPPSPAAHRVGWGFISLYTLAYMSTNLLFLAPCWSLGLEGGLAGREPAAPASLALVAAVGALLAMVANPFFGRMSDRTASPLGMRRPWMVGGLAGRFPRHRDCRAGPQHPGRPARMVHHPAVLQRAARRDGGGHARPDPVRPARPGLRCWVSVCRSGRCAARSWSSCSSAACSPCSWPRARSADLSSCFRGRPERPPAGPGG